tara:strand:+ start:2985 stop:3317 length:333 start_codon:yes stop_codon:yes gene_type:complete
MHYDSDSNIQSFKTYFENDCNIDANELQVGDSVENINPECDHYKSEGQVLKISTVPQDREKTAGNIVVYKVSNNSNDIDSKILNGIFSPDDILAKTEIQLKKVVHHASGE